MPLSCFTYFNRSFRRTSQSPSVHYTIPLSKGRGISFHELHFRENKSRILLSRMRPLPAPGRTRTGDLLITNQLLYQLSHGSAFLILFDFQRYNYTIGFRRCQPRFSGSFAPGRGGRTNNLHGASARRHVGRGGHLYPRRPI